MFTSRMFSMALIVCCRVWSRASRTFSPTLSHSGSSCCRSFHFADRLAISWTAHFYRATHMHSVDYVVARCLSVCLSIRPTHAGIVCKRLYISSKFFSPSGSPIILVFLYQMGWQYSDGDPLRAPNARGYEKNHSLRPISGFISELMQNRAIVTVEGE